MRFDPFPATSRYHGVGVRTWTAADGREITYLARRFVPPPERFEQVAEHRVAEGERLDHLAFDAFGDARQFFILCDANRAMHPAEMTAEIGRVLRITLPEGIPGATRA